MKALTKIILFVWIGLFLAPLSGKSAADSLLRELDKVLAQRPLYFMQKRADILEQSSRLQKAADAKTRFALTLGLCQEYESFNFDTAYIYSTQLVREAQSLNFLEYLGQARIRQAFSLLSAGLFRQALDSLETIDPDRLSSKVRADFFATKSRCYLDISRFLDDDNFSPYYLEKGVALLDSAIHYSRGNHLTNLAHRANRALLLLQLDQAEALFKKLITDPALPSRELARESASLGLVYLEKGELDAALDKFIIAAIADEENCVKENTALMLAAQILHDQGDYERSDRYIDLALEDAYFYNARLRKVQILDVLPLIKERQVALGEQKQRQLLVFVFLLAVLLLFCLVLIYNNIQKNRVLQQKEQKLTQAYRALESYTTALYEADKIKENYIGHFFQRHTKFIKYADKLFRNTRKALGEQKFKDAQFHSKQFQGRKEQQKLLEEFDTVFLTIFPNFVEQFNGLFPEEFHYPAARKTLDNPELRIFALIRLGVKNNETIARALDYSVNTIYTYKTKVRKRSLLSNEKFDEAVMNISGLGAENT
jgi:tetratricopeptide (TPR) repeat protein